MRLSPNFGTYEDSTQMRASHKRTLVIAAVVLTLSVIVMIFNAKNALANDARFLFFWAGMMGAGMSMVIITVNAFVLLDNRNEFAELYLKTSSDLILLRKDWSERDTEFKELSKHHAVALSYADRHLEQFLATRDWHLSVTTDVPYGVLTGNGMTLGCLRWLTGRQDPPMEQPRLLDFKLSFSNPDHTYTSIDLLPLQQSELIQSLLQMPLEKAGANAQTIMGKQYYTYSYDHRVRDLAKETKSPWMP